MTLLEHRVSFYRNFGYGTNISLEDARKIEKLLSKEMSENRLKNSIDGHAQYLIEGVLLDIPSAEYPRGDDFKFIYENTRNLNKVLKRLGLPKLP